MTSASLHQQSIFRVTIFFILVLYVNVFHHRQFFITDKGPFYKNLSLQKLKHLSNNLPEALVWINVKHRILNFVFFNKRRVYLKGRNFCGKKISRISRILTEFAKLKSFSDSRNCRLAKINSREIFEIGDLRKLISVKFFKNWWTANVESFCVIQCLLN